MIGSNVSIEWSQEDFEDLRKRSNKASKDVDKLAADLDMLRGKESDLLEEIQICDDEEMSLIYDFDKWIVYYNKVAESRMKEVQKRVKELRKKRMQRLGELTKVRTRICALESKCETLSYKQGEILWEGRIHAVKKRKWKA